MALLTTEQVKAYHRSEIPTDDDEFIDAACDAAEATLNMETGREWVVASTSSARVFVPESPCLVRIDDCTTVVSVSNDGATVASSDYQKEPLNGRSAGMPGVPYDRLRLLGGSVWYIDGREATVSVTATWGWAAIPARITQAALIIAKEIITNRDEVKLGLVGFSDVGGVVARTNPIVAATIAHYRRVEAFGIA